MHDLTIILTDNPAEQDRHAIRQQFRAYNDAVSLHHRAARKTGIQHLELYVRDVEERSSAG